MTSDTDDKHIARLAEMINARVAELGQKAARTASPSQLLVAVALGLAEDLDVAQQSRRHFSEKVRTTVRAAIARIDERLEHQAKASAPEESSLHEDSRS